MKLVVDTNVLVSALINPNGTPAKILRLVLGRAVSLCVDTRILLEYREVLHRPKFGFHRESVDDLLAFLEKESEIVFPLPSNMELIDPDDLPFYETALCADACLVTGNQAHFPKTSRVVSPSEFMQTYSNH